MNKAAPYANTVGGPLLAAAVTRDTAYLLKLVTEVSSEISIYLVYPPIVCVLVVVFWNSVSTPVCFRSESVTELMLACIVGRRRQQCMAVYRYLFPLALHSYNV